MTVVDYNGIRMAKQLDAYPDDMVHEVAADVEARLLASKIVGPDDLAWFVESVRRREPRVVRTFVTEGLQPKEALG